MLDIKFIRKNPNLVEEGIRAKGITDISISELLEIDKKKNEIKRELDQKRAEKNNLSQKIAQEKDGQKRSKLIAQSREIDQEVENLEKKYRFFEGKFLKIMTKIPNLPLADVKIGKDETENEILYYKGEPKHFKFKPKDHLEIGQKLDIIDVKRSAKTSGSRFGILKGKGALLEFALINFALDLLTKKGFIPVVPPVMLNERSMWGMGYLDYGREEVYYIPKDDLYLAGTSEQSIGAMHMDEIFSEKDLPKRYVGFSSCFRREAGSYGKDVRGILRVHQFDKVEMFSFCQPEKSEQEHQLLLSIEEEIMEKLEIPYRVVKMCTGDLGTSAAKKYDIEAWLPGQNKYRETHSTSNCTDWQARRLNIRFKRKNGNLEYVHMLNGTAIAIGRMIIAIVENYQKQDGSFEIPKILKNYIIKS